MTNNTLLTPYCRYLREYQALGTAGGIYHFRDEIIRGNPKQFFVMHVDVACNFPLNDMLSAHMTHRGLCTMLGTKVTSHTHKNINITVLTRIITGTARTSQ